jgi:hypothetical protein
MGVNLNFGVAGYVAVQDTNGRDLYRKPVNSETEAFQWIEANKESVPGSGILKSSFVVVRTDDLSKDLFLPTFINHVPKIKNLFLRAIASLFAIPWDILTFASRLISLPIKICIKPNAATPSPKLPVQTLIENSCHFKEALKNGVVHLVAHVEDIQMTETLGERRPDIIVNPALKDLPFVARKTSYDLSCDVLLKELPWHQENVQSSHSTEFFMRSFPSGLWNYQFGGRSSQYAAIVAG